LGINGSALSPAFMYEAQKQYDLLSKFSFNNTALQSPDFSKTLSYIDINNFYIQGSNSSIRTNWVQEDSFNNSSNFLEISYTPENKSDRAILSWPLKELISDETNISLKLFDIAVPITVTLVGKGFRGDEWIDLQVNTSGKYVNYSITFQDYLEETSYVLYTNRSIDEISIIFTPGKNPVGATIFLRDISIGYMKDSRIYQDKMVQSRKSIEKA
jgi:hypothetical protein